MLPFGGGRTSPRRIVGCAIVGMVVLGGLRQRNFALVWVAGLISLTGDWLLFVALPLAV